MKKIITFFCVFMLTFTNVYAYDKDIYNTVLSSVLEDTKEPYVSSIGGEWAVIALSRSGRVSNSAYYNEYYKKALEFIDSDNVRRYSDYSRLILAITATGNDTVGIEKKLSEFDNVVSQGINGAIYALIALDSNNYECAIRGEYLNFILSRQLADGGWSISGDTSDIDVTAMALQALSGYRHLPEVETAINRGLSFINSSRITTSESASQCIIAMTALDIDPTNYINELMDYYSDGRFLHIKGGEVNAMATEQGALALTAYERYKNGQSTLYDMSEAAADIKSEDCVFIDVLSEDANMIMWLFEHGIINGKTDLLFAPDATLTRAQMTAITVRAMAYNGDIKMSVQNCFKDVKTDDWFRIYVNTAAGYGIVNGVTPSRFNPNGTITADQMNLILDRFCAYLGKENTVHVESASRIDAARAVYGILCGN